MNKILIEGICTGIKAYKLVESYNMAKVDGVLFCDLIIANLERFKITAVVCFNKNADSFNLKIRWERENSHRGKFANTFVRPNSNEISVCEFVLGEEVDGRGREFHFVEGLECDQKASYEKIYSTGKGPSYRLLRVPDVLETVEIYLKHLKKELLEAWYRFSHDLP